MNLYSFAIGIGTKDSQQNWLEVYYPAPQLNPDSTMLQTIADACGYSGGNVALELSSESLTSLRAAVTSYTELSVLLESLSQSSQPLVATFLENDSKPETVPEVYLKLHLLSHRLCKPHGTNLEGMFGALPNVAWTSEGAISISDLPARQLASRLRGETIEVTSVDKFPKMTDYHVPTGVRIADTARVRLGAHIGDGTTIMHEGFVNFNAGTLGTAMIEGRISAGVVVGNNSDLGGGCSTMGTLSGGGNEVISVGENCLIGANAGLGFPLGDRCTIESGLYLTAGTKVTVLDNNNQIVEIVKARELSGKHDLLFRRNSVSGTVECKTNKTTIELNAELHSHN